MSQPISVKIGNPVSEQVSGVTPDETPRPTPRTALECLAKVAACHGIDLPAERLRHAYAIDSTAFSTSLLLRMAKDAGLRAQATHLDWGALVRLGEAYPALVRLSNENWIVVLGAGQGPDGAQTVSIFDPLAERQNEPLVVEKDRFCARWGGEAMLIKREGLSSENRREFGLRWFVPELLRQWRLFADVAIAAVLLYALGLALPMFFQLVIDKVLVHESFTTLYVLTIG
ncbi:MAG: cysteine peptidase family C39 domain-containing protein, partial [Rhizomicrobium sp.]